MAFTPKRQGSSPLSIVTDNDSPIKTTRIARFAEATSVDSPIDGPVGYRFNDRTPYTPVEHVKPQLQPGDVGYGTGNDRRSMAEIPHVEMPSYDQSAQNDPPLSPPLKSPLKSAMKAPGMKSPPMRIDIPPKTPGFAEDTILSPTWREEKLLEKREARTTKRQADDLRVKVRVRMAKLILRFTNFSCSLIILAMLGTVITVFNSTVNLPARNTLPAWAPGTPRWPQLTVLCIACVSLFFSVVIIIAYCKKGHKRAEKWAAYYSMIAVGFFIVSIVMWATGAGILQHSKNNGNGKDLWGWACKTNTREKVFGEHVNYKLLCRLQNWSLVCTIIEVVVEVITILVYGIVFWRYWSKRRLAKTMNQRDNARSKLYLSQMKSPGFFPSTPGIPPPQSARDGGYNPAYSPRFAPGSNSNVDAAEKGQVAHDPSTQFTSLNGAMQPPPPKFTLSKPPTKSPKTPQRGFGFSNDEASPELPHGENINEHVSAAPGEQQYGAVPVPGSYSTPAYYGNAQ